MLLIVGGAGQGKLAYALERLGLDESQVSRDPARPAPVVAGLETWLRAHPNETDVLEALLQARPDVAILCREVGGGVIPLDREEREWRERVGRVCCGLAARADCVVRLCCGLPAVLKGTPPSGALRPAGGGAL